MGSCRSRRNIRRAPLTLEPLESRQLLTAGFQPTNTEQLFLEQLNDIRADPAAFGAAIGVDLSGVPPSPPLALNPQLTEAAELHSQDMNARGYFGHDTPEGLDPGGQISQAGFAWTSWGQSLAAGAAYSTTESALAALITDNGEPDLIHRRQLLAIDAIFQAQNQVGIGIVQNGTGPLVNYYTIDTASSAFPWPLLTGVVFRDYNQNGGYDAGEGLGGVTVTVAGIGSVTTFNSGGYTIAVPPGTYTVTASGGDLPAPISRTITVGLANVRLQFIYSSNQVANTNYVQQLYRTVLGRTGSAPEVGNWVVELDGGLSRWNLVWAIENSPEARDRLVKGWYATYLGRQPVNGEEWGWVTALLQGATETSVLTGILESQEFYQRAGVLFPSGSSDQSYIVTLYEVLLHRTPSANELDTWLTRLQVYGPGVAAAGFVQSQEYRTDVVVGYYYSLLHRSSAPSAAEVAGWVNSGWDFTPIRVGFEASAEYYLKA